MPQLKRYILRYQGGIGNSIPLKDIEKIKSSGRIIDTLPTKVLVETESKFLDGFVGENTNWSYKEDGTIALPTTKKILKKNIALG